VIIPTTLQIEPVNGICTARCTMCAFPTWTRKPHRMSMKDYTVILERFMPYREHLQYLSLQGFGESLLDSQIAEKVREAKRLGFKGIGFATNCTELNAETSTKLLDAGIDTLICSIDGITKESHEAIRIGTNYEEIVDNVLNFIDVRNLYHYDAKVIIRFIRQKANAHEWEEFKAYWEAQLRPSDAVVSFDIVDCDSKVKDFADKDVSDGADVPCECDQLYQRIIVLSNGNIVLCCADDNDVFSLGRVFITDPIEIYNNATFTHHREMMRLGKVNLLHLCKTCTIPRSQKLKDKVT